MEHILEIDCDICFIQETWLNKNDDSKIAEIKDYGLNIISNPRKRLGGGVAAIYKNNIKLKSNQSTPKYNTFEVMETTLQTKQGLLRFINIYRTHYSKKNRFTVEASWFFIFQLAIF